MKKWQILELFKLGGSGSGHFGHKGIPGQRGGSAASGGGNAGGAADVKKASSDIFVGNDPSTWNGRGAGAEMMKGSEENAARVLRKVFGVEPKGEALSITLKDKYTLPQIYERLESLGMSKMEKPSYAQKFDADWYKRDNRVVRVLGRGLIRGTEDWKSLMVFDL